MYRERKTTEKKEKMVNDHICRLIYMATWGTIFLVVLFVMFPFVILEFLFHRPDKQFTLPSKDWPEPRS